MRCGRCWCCCSCWGCRPRGWRNPTGRRRTIQKLADLGQQFYVVTTCILLGLVGLAAPAATAGAICLDKARGI
ncbi:MAG: hypothetical protein U0790_11715 [Isosphaeraceae bacterium]